MTQVNLGLHCPVCGAAVAGDAAYCGHCGSAQPERRAVATPTAPGASRAPGRGRLFRPLVLMGAVIGLVVVVTIPLLISRLTAAAPEDVVRSYFEALADRDADAARALLDARSKEQTDPSMLTDRILRNSGYTPPREVEVEVVDSLTDSATVRARYKVGRGEWRRELNLRRGGDSADREAWRIQNGTLPLELPTLPGPDDTFLVAGTPVPATRHTLEAVFPGAYLIALKEHAIHEAPPITAVAGTAGDRLVVRLRPTVRQAIEPLVREYLDRCAASTDLDPPGCPFRRAGTGISQRPVTDVRWKITQYPTLNVGLTSTGNALISSTMGAAQATGRTGPPAGEFAYRTLFSVNGEGRVHDGKIVFVPAA